MQGDGGETRQDDRAEEIEAAVQQRKTAVTTIGEAMVVLFPDGGQPLADATTFGSDTGGAEFNVATSVARMGVPTAWISRLGDDGFGERIRRAAADAGLDTSAVEIDAERPTGLYVKEAKGGPDGLSTRMHYYRRDSAASAIGPDLFATPAAAAALRDSRIVHTSGITPALSPSSAAAVSGLRSAVGAETIVSVDLNYRPQLWQGRTAEALTALVSQADLLFAGLDEAETHFGHSDTERLFAENPALSTLVLKDDVRRATSVTRDGETTHVPCLTVEVVEPVGAGDAFAAGYLAALAEGRDEVACLRLGHAVAALTLIVAGDRPAAVPTAAERGRIASAADDEWAGWRVHPGDIPWRTA
ncbi:sugar kinase [Leifsonia sp. NPDC058292]|uniref:sugar kinase n=1 Tax=Leifsonia sp. NPDC058292 TaxID=3346428 RepID=UPI0036D886CE